MPTLGLSYVRKGETLGVSLYDSSMPKVKTHTFRLCQFDKNTLYLFSSGLKPNKYSPEWLPLFGGSGRNLTSLVPRLKIIAGCTDEGFQTQNKPLAQVMHQYEESLNLSVWKWQAEIFPSSSA